MRKILFEKVFLPFSRFLPFPYYFYSCTLPFLTRKTKNK
jgi:hypothetical protein